MRPDLQEDLRPHYQPARMFPSVIPFWWPRRVITSQDLTGVYGTALWYMHHMLQSLSGIVGQRTSQWWVAQSPTAASGGHCNMKFVGILQGALYDPHSLCCTCGLVPTSAYPARLPAPSCCLWWWCIFHRNCFWEIMTCNQIWAYLHQLLIAHELSPVQLD